MIFEDHIFSKTVYFQRTFIFKDQLFKYFLLKPMYQKLASVAPHGEHCFLFVAGDSIDLQFRNSDWSIVHLIGHYLLATILIRSKEELIDLASLNCNKV